MYNSMSDIIAILSITSSIVITQSVLADNANRPLANNNTIDEMIVVGQKQAPISVEPRGLAVSLGEEHFAATNAINLEDLMKYAPNFFVRKRYIGDANGVPGFRGTHSTQSARTLVLVDGFVVSNYLGNSFSFPPKWGLVGPGEVQQFDIVYGPYSSRYQGNSMGGLISIRTRSPEKNEAFVTLQGFSQPYQQYNTDDSYNGYAFEGGFALKQDDGPLAIRGSYRHFENKGQPMSWSQLIISKNTRGIAVTGAIEDNNLVPATLGAAPTPIFAAASPDDNMQDQLRLRGDLTFDNWSLQSVLVYWTTDSNTTQPTSYLRDINGNSIYTGTVNINGNYWDATALNLSLTERCEIFAGLSVKGSLAEWDSSVNLSHFWLANVKTRTSQGYLNGINNGDGTLTKIAPSGWWTLDTKATQQFNAHEITLGFTSNRYTTDSITSNTTHWRDANNSSFSLETEGTSSLSGLFAEDDIHLSNNLNLTAGVRMDQWQAFDGGIKQYQTKINSISSNRYDVRTETDTNVSLSSQWTFRQRWLAQLSLATATRFPTVGELFQGKFDSSGNFDSNSFDPNLHSETSRDANLIIRHDFTTASISGSFFYQKVNDFIFSFEHQNVTGAKLTSFVNIDKVRQTGVEIIAETHDWLAHDLNMDINIAYIDDKILKNSLNQASQGQQFPRIPFWRINSQIRYSFSQHWRASAGFRYSSRPYNNLENTQSGDGYGYASEQLIADTRLSWQAFTNTDISIGIDNINNDKAWAFHPFPQRTYLFELKWKH